MVTRNAPAIGIFNGDVGIALPGAHAADRLRVYFPHPEGVRAVSPGRLAQVETAFAATVHKSQGSEFDHTALVLAAHSGSALTRELLYTGITRARQAFTLISEQPGLLEQGLARVTRRESGLSGL
jgi:exodeoxyribonuclease V alpha subunit